MMGMFGAVALAAGSAGAAEVEYDGAGFIRGQQAGMESFSVSGPGTLTVQLSNVAWPVPLGSLNAVISSASGLLGPEMGAGVESFQVSGAGEIFAQWFGTAQGPLNVGVYALKIDFSPSSVMPVPLPASIGLLLSGLALLGWQRRHRTDPLDQQQLAS
ncbi:MAG TPA: PEP-CTERM sorting domain-containing protein [Steroidobacteraceae bacterium]